MGKALVVTVGTGVRPDRDIVRPLVKTVRSSHPDLVVFLVTEESEPNAGRVSAELGLGDGSWEVVRLRDADDVDQIFQEVVAVLRSLEARGYAPADLEVDYTSGTKSMSAALVLAGMACGCRALKYVAGRREGGVVVDGTERILTIAPAAILARQELDLAWALFRGLRFDAALSVCQRVSRLVVEDSVRRELEDLERLIRGYDRWDKFDHLGGCDELRGVDFSNPWNADFRLPEGLLEERLACIGGRLREGSITEDVLADLANNAVRRRLEGKYDDAVARLYRLVEMIAQRELRLRYGIRTNRVDLEKVPEDLRPRLETRRDERDGRIRIGMVDAYSLLEELKSPLGSSYRSNGNLAGLLRRRNDSILAHGTTPVGKDACDGLLGEAMALGELAVPDLATRRRELQFPWLRDEPDPAATRG